MDSVIIVIWWATLLGALVLTVVAVKLVLLIVRTEREILHLAHRTWPAARGIVTNTALISRLEATKGVAGKILTSAKAIESHSASIEQKLRSVPRALTERRS